MNLLENADNLLFATAPNTDAIENPENDEEKPEDEQQ